MALILWINPWHLLTPTINHNIISILVIVYRERMLSCKSIANLRQCCHDMDWDIYHDSCKTWLSGDCPIYKIIIVDDCLMPKISWTDTMHKFFYQGRHFKIDYIDVVQ